MSGYAKMWTSIIDEDWWEEASGLERGCYMQTIVLIKKGNDDGHLCCKNAVALGKRWGVDSRTANKIVAKLQSYSCLVVSNNEFRHIILTVPKYRFYQELTAKEHAAHTSKKLQKCRKNAHEKFLLNQTKPDQTKPDHSPPAEKPPKKTNPDHAKVVEYFCQAYQNKLGGKYAFKDKRDAGRIKTMLGHWNLEQIKHLIDTMFASSDEFYRTGGGYSIGVLLANDNKLFQEAKRVHEGTDKLSKHGAATAAAAARVLKEMECRKTQKKLPL